MQYTQDQEKAIKTRHKNILVAAAAGSGKTRVLVARIISQILAHECSVDEMLVVTFTNAAAAEMRERIDKALGEALQQAEKRETAAWLERQQVLLSGASICTFHAFCQRVIRQNIDAIDVDPQFRLGSDQEMTLMKRDVLEDLLEQEYKMPEQEEDRAAWQDFLAFADDYGDDHGDDKVCEAVLKLYEFSQSQPYPAAWLREQKERYAKSGGDIWQTPWTGTILMAFHQELARAIKAFEETCFLVHAEEESELFEAWQPYIDILQQCIEQLEDVEGLRKTVCREKEPGGFDALGKAAAGVKFPALRGKKFNALKERFPELRQAFEKQRDAAKKIFADARARYFGESEAEILARIEECGATVRRYVNLTLDFMTAFQAAKKERNVLDFNDLEHFALAVLCADPEKLSMATAEDFAMPEGDALRTDAARDLREKYAVIMVDEYQDTNSVQEAILDLIARDDNRFTVGDVKQSIYRFRLADPYLFQAKYDAYPEHPEAEDKNQLITMKQNFRSRAEVLAPINFIFDQVMTREAMEIEYDEKSRLYPGAQYPVQDHTLAGPMELDIILRQDAEDEGQAEKGEGEELSGFALEAQHIADRIASLMADAPLVFDKDAGGYRPLAYRDIAILLRAVKGKANVLLETLRQNSIPAYADVDGGYFEANEVRLVLALLQVIDNSRQEIPLAAVLVSPLGGFSMEELARLRMSVPEEDLYGALLKSHSVETELPANLADRAAGFCAQLDGWRTYAVSHSVPELIWTLYRDTGYYEYVGGLKGGLLRQANLRMLADRAADYEKTNYRGLFRFLRFIEDLRKRDTDLSVARTLGASEDVVRIMSIHKSKGLEFPVVFLADTAKGFNLRDTQGAFLLHKELGIGPRVVSRSAAGRQMYDTVPAAAVAARLVAESKAEEMRVLYVAMTRARERLILTGTMSASSWQKKVQAWCQSLSETDTALPAVMIRRANSYLDWVAPAIARHADGAALRAAAGCDWGTLLTVEPDAHFAVQLIPANEVQPHEEEIRTDDPILLAVQQKQPLPPSPRQAWVEKRLDWKYPWPQLAHITAKMTVSEIKQRFTAMAREDDPLPGSSLLHPAETAWRRPSFLQRTTELSATERGTLFHAVLQHLDLQGDVSEAGIHAQVLAMAARGFIPSGCETAVDYGSLSSFCQSGLGQRMKNAVQLWRELPFSRLLPVSGIDPAVQGEESIFIQGVIDVLFEEADGKLVLLDYKTDRDTRPARVRERYAKQVELYREAVAGILGRPVKESILYLLHDGTAVTL